MGEPAPPLRVRDRPSLVTSASLTLGGRVAAFGFSLVTNIILARALGPEGRGVYAVAILIPAILALLVQLGIGPATTYYHSKGLIDREELIAHAVSLALLLGTACYLILVAFIGLAHAQTFLGIASEYVLVVGTSLPFLLLTIFLMGLIQGEERFVQFNLVQLAQYGLPALALVVAMLISRTTLSAVIAWAASAVLTAGVAIYSVLPVSSFPFGLRRSTLSSLLRFGLISYLGTLTSFVNYRFDVFIVNLFAGARQVGLYSVGTGLAEIVWYVPNAASIVLAPRVASSEPEAADRTTESVGRVVIFLTVVVAGVLALLAPIIVVAFFGSAFSESVWAVWLLLPGIVTYGLGRVLAMYLLGRNKLKVDLLASAVGMVMTLALDLTLIPRFGFRGAAVASSIAYTCAMAVDLVWVLRHSTISPGALLIPRRQDGRVMWARLRASGLTGAARVEDSPTT